MAERRSLIEGIKSPTIDPQLEAQFIHGEKASTAVPAARPTVVEPLPAPAAVAPAVGPEHAIVEGRVLFSVRVRTDLATRIKRLSLQRQLTGREPNRLQDISEEALEAWLNAQEPTA